MAMPDYALVVGIDRYPGLAPLASLRGAEADARAFLDWVMNVAGVQPGFAKLIVSSGFAPAGCVRDEQPASEHIWDFFDTIRAASAANNQNNHGLAAGRRLYMFFSGHGFSSSLDSSAVLMANAEQDAPHNLSAKAWADRFYENGLFEEVLLFQDACRERVSEAEITPPYLRLRPMPGAAKRRRFYAFAAKTPQMAIEKPDGKGITRGVFAATLMAGLTGGARDPVTGEITAAQLKTYLQANMAARLDANELLDEDISQRPEVFDLDPLVIVGAPAAPQVPETFPVRITLPAPNLLARVLDTDRAELAREDSAPQLWATELPRGIFMLVVAGLPDTPFQVTGALTASGKPEFVNVTPA